MYQYKEDGICPVCGEGKLKKKIVEETFQYKAKKLVIPNYVVFACDKCKEEFVDGKTMKKTEKVIRDFHRETDGLLTSAEIKSIRQKIGKTQEEMGLILGLGKKSFVRYENGQMTQAKPLDILLRLLSHEPSLLERLSPGQSQLNFALEAMSIEEPVIVSKYKQKNPFEFIYEEDNALAA